MIYSRILFSKNPAIKLSRVWMLPRTTKKESRDLTLSSLVLLSEESST